MANESMVIMSTYKRYKIVVSEMLGGWIGYVYMPYGQRLRGYDDPIHQLLGDTSEDVYVAAVSFIDGEIADGKSY